MTGFEIVKKGKLIEDISRNIVQSLFFECS